jgi:hypothetical protein
MCSALAWGVGLMGPHAAPALLGFNRRAGALSGGLRGPLANREWEWNMSDPRYSDSRRNDELRRYGVQEPDGAGFWPWLMSALTALGLLIGGIIGHNWGWSAHEKLAQSSPPTTTGSAPSQPRPAPQTQ